MADKLRKTFPIVITFSSSEQPSNEKLTAISTQARNGLGVLEKTIGDIWNQSADVVLSSFPLQLPNTARMIGQSKYLNPVIYSTTDSFFFFEDLVDNWNDVTTGYLLFKPASLPSIVCVDQTTGGQLTRVSNEEDVNNDYEFWVDGDTGRFRFYDEIDGSFNIRIKYQVSPVSDWVSGTEVLPGVIPDVRQSGFVGCRISENAGTFYLHLPPRTALTTDTRETPRGWPSGNQISDNQAATLDAADRRLWQDPTADAFDDEHYRYSFPKEIQDTLALLVAGTTLPAGFMYLWDQGNETIVEDVVFKKADLGKDWIVEIESNTLDLAALATSDETTTSYNSGYSLIVCGAPLARWTWMLASSFLRHRHDNSGDFSAPISHGNLLDQNVTGLSGFFSEWTASNWNFDDHTYLLSRYGAQTLENNKRDLNNNAMMGHLLMADSAETSVSGLWLDADSFAGSFSIFFQDLDGPSINGQEHVLRVDASGFRFPLVGEDFGSDLGVSRVDDDTGRLSVSSAGGWERMVGKVFAGVEVADLRSSNGSFSQQFTLEADSLNAGSVVRIRAHGEVSGYTDGEIILALRLGGDAILEHSEDQAITAGWEFLLDSMTTIRSIGASGSWTAGGTTALGLPIGNTAVRVFSKTGVIDTTISNILDVELTLSGTATIRLDGFVVDISD